MAQLTDYLLEAWRLIRQRLEADPHELARRLARRRSAVLTRPPRAWCLALRASDGRIDDGDEVTLDAEELRRLCSPVRIAWPGEPLRDVAKKLGATPMGLTSARLAHVFRVRHIPLLGGSRGKPVPLLYTDRPLDPAARLFAEADPVWNWTAKWLTDRIPACPELAEGRSVTLTRVPHYRPHAPRRLYDDRAHPEAHDVDGLDVLKRRKRLPPPEPDPVWYKWSRETKDHEPHFLGDDPSNWRKGPNDYGHRPPRFLTKRKSPPRVRPSTSSGSEHFNGHHWLCPACGKRCRTIFLPLPPVNLLAREQPRLAQIVDIPRRLDGFACVRCHRVRYFSRIDRNGWNGFIAYISGGLLYGHEVPRPTSIPRDRKRRYRPCLNRAPSARRAQVLERLLKGMTYDEIAADLRVGYATVHGHVKVLYKQHGVHSVRELAAKQHVQLPTRGRARKQAEVARRLKLGQTPARIARETGLSICAVRHHVKAIRRAQRARAPVS